VVRKSGNICWGSTNDRQTMNTFNSNFQKRRVQRSIKDMKITERTLQETQENAAVCMCPASHRVSDVGKICVKKGFLD